MARNRNRLTDLKVKALKDEGLHPDGDGLYLRVTETGTKSWVFRFKFGGKLRGMGLGKYPNVPLSAARELAAKNYVLVKSGVDPIAQRKQLEAPAAKHIVTFAEAAERYIAAHQKSWRNPKHRQQWANTLAEYAGPVIGAKDVAEVNTDDILRILEPIWTEKAETATRVRGRMENVLDWAKVRELRSGENPARWRGHLSHLLPARNKAKTVRHHPALPWREIPEFMAKLRANACLSARALEFTILTVARTGESIDAQWPEVDIRERVWTVPKERMKAGREHRVPLTDAAANILAELPHRVGNPHLFPGGQFRPLSKWAMLELVRGMRPGLTVHGFRSTFRDWAAEMTAFPRELAEATLAHITGSATERAYQRGDLFEKRRKLMQAWAEFCARGEEMGEVVPLMRRDAG